MKALKISVALALVFVLMMNGRAGATHPTVDLGTADSFAVLAGASITNTNSPTVVNGDLGVSPGNSISGFPPGTVNGTVHNADAVAAQAQSDLTTAYNSAAGRACNTVLTGQNLGGLTLTAGVYCFASSAQLTGVVTLDAQGDPNGVFIFQIGSSLTTASNSSVALINSAQACNVFWQVGSSATLGTTTAFRGSILALTSITLDTSATVADGRVLARNGSVTLDNNTITRPTCNHPSTASSSPSPSAGSAAGSSGTNSRRRSGRRGSGSATGGQMPDTGTRLPTGMTVALGAFMVLIGALYNYLGTSSSTLALSVRRYQPKRRAAPWRKV